MSPRVPNTDSVKVRQFAVEAAQLMDDRHCEGVLLLDVRGLSQVCDYVLIGSGTSERQMKSVASEIDELGEAAGQRMFRSNRDTANTWMICDFVDLVVHLFEPNQRLYYDIESLWDDAPRIAWQEEPRRAKDEG